jgi:hypothetical protein
MIEINCEQGSPEWFEYKTGRPSASNFKKFITSAGKRSKSAREFEYRLAAEQIAKCNEDSFSNFWMDRGIELEPEARQFYEFLTGNQVRQVGLCFKDDDRLFSCSPDGLIDPDGGLEIKCPNMATHLRYLHGGKCPADYYQQVQGTLYITGRDWWDFFSYHPDLPHFLIRCYPDADFEKALEDNLVTTLENVEKIITEVNA